ncbi:MAG: hypothetical protein ACRC2W_16715 [Plesiomonas shigelloides]
MGIKNAIYLGGFAMHAVGPAAIFHTLIFVVLCGALLAAFSILPGMNIKWYPSIVVPLISISPTMYSSLTANRLYAKLRRPLTGPEHIAFAVLLSALLVVVAGLCEAGIVYLTFGRASGLSFADILLVPLSERYTLKNTGGISFAAKTLFASAVAGLIFIPMRLRLLTKTDKAG